MFVTVYLGPLDSISHWQHSGSIFPPSPLCHCQRLLSFMGIEVTQKPRELTKKKAHEKRVTWLSGSG